MHIICVQNYVINKLNPSLQFKTEHILIDLSICYFIQVNTFQCILATSEIESFVIFLYSDLQWTTGDSSFGKRGLGGFKALAGYNAGDKINSHTIAGSRTSKIIEIARTSNVGIPGTWIFKVGQG